MKISIRWAMVLGCLGLIWGMQILITSSSYISSQRMLAGHACDVMQNIADLTMTQSRNHLQLAQRAALLTKRLLASEVVGRRNQHYDVLEHYFLDQLSLYSHFAGIYIGMPNGDFFYVNRSNAQTPGGFRTKVIDHFNGVKKIRLIWRNSDGSMVKTLENPSDTYDPRQRPWYQKALAEREIIWTDPYIFFSSQKPGITVAGPIFKANGQLQSIVGVDIEIDDLSTFISRLRIGKHGRAFMLNNNGDVVAFPDISKIKQVEDTEAHRFRMVKIDELDDELSRSAFSAIQWQRTETGLLKLDHSQFAKFTHNGDVYNTMFTQFTDSHWPWMFGVYIPENDYLGALKENRSFNIGITLVLSVIATLVGLQLFRSITRPLMGLEKEALAIKQHDLTASFNTRSIFKEIDETAAAFSQMKYSLQTSEKKYRQIFENIQDIYFECTIEGEILEISPSVEGLIQQDRKNIIGINLTQFYKNADDHQRFLSKIFVDGSVSDWEVALENEHGEIAYGSVSATLKRDEAGDAEKIIGSLRIITDRKKAEFKLRRYQDQLEDLVEERTQDLQKSNGQLRNEIETRKEKEEALRRSEEKYRSIIENTNNGYYEVDLDGRLTFFNDSLAVILGYSVEELQGMDYSILLESEGSRQLPEKSPDTYRSGVNGNLSRLTITRKDGDRRTVDVSTAPIFDNNGGKIGYRGVVLDISERLNAEAEKQKLQERLRLIQRLEGIGTLAGGVAHDFNNLLMGIQGNISLMMLKTNPSEYHYKKLKSIESCVSSGTKLTQQLLGFARGGKYMAKSLNFNQIVMDTARMFGRTRKEIQIEENIEHGLWAVVADKNQIEQVLLNIYINAWQAMPDGGSVVIDAKNMVLDALFSKTFDIQPGRYVCVSISDTGIGIDPAIQTRIFEPFFTTKGMGRGTGLGLASAYGIIKNHDGAIDFVSQPGKGTTFYIYLPASDGDIETEPALCEMSSKGSETLLLIDDEEVILQVGQPMLESLGYKVMSATDGKTAVDIFRRFSGEIDLVILDVIMPGMSGSAIFDALKNINPQVQVLLASGYSLSGQAEDILSRGCVGFIQKPFSLEQISVRLRGIFDNQDL
ncbi:oxidoreductase [Desulfobacter hydrogenophilus]|uniref:histidine kinase n=1 Tax=Desulfobacter hydrogenophilus TaxID=2291 RepID=A0A328F7Q1_9BACT|nr:PAS domain S-box protein [Desulfobacter hydrogenophilus]NDY74273.1 PAS domain S-box protein [Desulfobacter hydrogenophilus]QBH14603.1 PAS domain S-box protein [Desulfobacter hydrogenophilus]RAM00409.1 oxidoreductase [Desulfobacter hydrogenophilus]